MLKRTPPPKSSPSPSLQASMSPLRHTESEPNIAAMKAINTERKKRKYGGDDSSMSDALKEMFSTYSLDQKKSFDALLSVVNTIKDQNEELTKSVDMMSTKYDEFLSRIATLEQKRVEDRQYITALEEKIEFLERKTRAAGIEIHIPKVNYGQKP